MGRYLLLESSHNEVFDIGKNGDMHLFDLLESADAAYAPKYEEVVGFAVDADAAVKAADWITQWLANGHPEEGLAAPPCHHFDEFLEDIGLDADSPDNAERFDVKELVAFLRTSGGFTFVTE